MFLGVTPLLNIIDFARNSELIMQANWDDLYPRHLFVYFVIA